MIGDVKNYLLVAEARLPLEDADSGTRDRYDESAANPGVASAIGKVSVMQKIPHDGDVNRARHMPQNPNVVATKTETGKVYVFDLTKHGATPVDNVCRPDLTLQGHSREGYGLCWSKKSEGLLLSAADEPGICLWDVNRATRENTNLQPISTYSAHTALVEDVNWHHFHNYLFGSCGDDRKLFMYVAYGLLIIEFSSIVLKFYFTLLFLVGILVQRMQPQLIQLRRIKLK